MYEVPLSRPQMRKFRQLPETEGVRQLVFSPDGKMLATGHADGTIHLLEVATRQERRCFRGHRGEITALAFTPDGKRLISGSKDTTALVWDVRSLEKAK